MGRTLTPERQSLKEWAVCLRGGKLTERRISSLLGQAKTTIHDWLNDENITDHANFILDQYGHIVHNSGFVVDNFRDGLPPNPKPQLFVGRAENLHFLNNDSINVIITSPPYNLGQEKWPMGGNGRKPREAGIGYSDHEDDMPEDEYQNWQIQCINEFHRIAKNGASLFYNHKVRQRSGEIIHPISWLKRAKWQIRQEVIWDRLSTHNHTSSLFWPQDERIYWLTKGKPDLPEKSINIPSVWRVFGPIPTTDHPAPFTKELPKMILGAIGKPGDIILDPFGGGMTTCRVASSMGYKSIGVDIAEDYVKRTADYFGVSYGRG